MQFHAYRVRGLGLILDLQTDILDTPGRVAAPLVPVEGSLPVLRQLEPVLPVGDVPHVLRMSQLLTLPRGLMSGRSAADLSGDDYAIRRALDMLFSGF